MNPSHSDDRTPSNSQAPLEVIVFPGGFNWPLFVAQDKSIFASERLDVNITPTPDSKFQMVNLIDGAFDIAMTAMDNVIAYNQGQGAASTKSLADIFAFMGVDNGFLRLVAVPEVTSIRDLRGKRVGVDAPNTGYAFVLIKLLAGAGLVPGDYELVEAGGVAKRFEALMAKELDATLLVSPFEAEAEKRGFNRLADGQAALGAYQGVVGTARRAWAAENRDRLIRFIRAYRRALNWLYEPANQSEAVLILRKRMPAMSADAAEASYRILLDRETGFFKGAQLDDAGVEKVRELRNEYGNAQRTFGASVKHVDTTYLAAVEAQL